MEPHRPCASGFDDFGKLNALRVLMFGFDPNFPTDKNLWVQVVDGKLLIVAAAWCWLVVYQIGSYKLQREHLVN